MRLTDLQRHFHNNNVGHCHRMDGGMHDVYKHRQTGRRFTIPIDEDEIPDEYCQWGCLILGIEGINGEPHFAIPLFKFGEEE